MNRPFVFINAAMSVDGKISTIERRQTRISGDSDFERVDALRAGSDAVMVGIGTILSDNPSLTVKSPERRKKRLKEGKEENPIRIVVDSLARTPIDSDVLNRGKGRRIIVTSENAPFERTEKLRKFAEVISCGRRRVDLEKMLHMLKDMRIGRIMVEGGARLNWGLISRGLVDELYVFIGNIVIGGEKSPTLVDGEGFIKREDMPELELLDMERMDDGVLLRWKFIRQVPSR
ncbi:MAG: 2,5-diamino-6-(ribosylamino)-4(3H)-pyrimidinone 5'-phosphate reductase [Candidatus Syntropharchaeia archaeon]